MFLNIYKLCPHWTDSTVRVFDVAMRPRHAVGSVVVLVLLAAFWLMNRMPSPPAPRSSSAPAPAIQRNGRDVPVPQSCTPAVNQGLADLVAQHASATVDNVMVCGVTISPSRTQRGGEHGSHQILFLLVNFPSVGSKLVEVVTNDELNGVVTAPKGAEVYAFGQAFFDRGSRFAAGIHDVHCATHRQADNGWVIVNGVKSPASCPAQ
jgi:hypothetical protein